MRYYGTVAEVVHHALRHEEQFRTTEDRAAERRKQDRINRYGRSSGQARHTVKKEYN